MPFRELEEGILELVDRYERIDRLLEKFDAAGQGDPKVLTQSLRTFLEAQQLRTRELTSKYWRFKNHYVREQAKLAAIASSPAHGSAHELARLDQLTTTIVHQMKQPLSSIALNSSAGLRLLRAGGKSATIEEILNDIHDTALQAARMISELRGLAHNELLTLTNVNLNDLVRETAKTVGADALRLRATLNLELAPSLPVIVGDASLLEQIVSNLVVNALDATDQASDSERLVEVRTSQNESDVELAVTNTGPPIPPENRAKLFDPYFTTKPKGFGLGLTIARTIAEAHRGRLWLDEQNKRGTTFRLSLPVAASSVPASA